MGHEDHGFSVNLLVQILLIDKVFSKATVGFPILGIVAVLLFLETCFDLSIR
jgi:hypothetical protein